MRTVFGADEGGGTAEGARPGAVLLYASGKTGYSDRGDLTVACFNRRSPAERGPVAMESTRSQALEGACRRGRPRASAALHSIAADEQDRDQVGALPADFHAATGENVQPMSTKVIPAEGCRRGKDHGLKLEALKRSEVR